MRLTKGFCSCLCSYCLWDGKEGQFLHHQKNKPGLAEQRVGDAWLLSYWVGEISILSAVSPLERSPLAPEGFCRLTCGSWPAREEGQWMAEWEWHQGMGSGEPGEGFHSCCCWSKGHWCALKDGIVLRGTSCGCSTVLDAGLFLYAQAHWRPGMVKHYVCYSSCCMWQSPLRSMKPQWGPLGQPHLCLLPDLWEACGAAVQKWAHGGGVHGNPQKDTSASQGPCQGWCTSTDLRSKTASGLHRMIFRKPGSFSI